MKLTRKRKKYVAPRATVYQLSAESFLAESPSQQMSFYNNCMCDEDVELAKREGGTGGGGPGSSSLWDDGWD